MLRAWTRWPAIVQHRFVADELMTVLLQNRAGERLAAHHEHGLVVLLQFVDQRDEVAVAADDGERVDVIVREGQFQGIERQVDVRAVLVAPRRRIALHHLHRVFGKLARRIFQLSPVCVSDFGDNLAAFLQGFQHDGNVEFALKRRFHADFDVVEVDKDRDLQVLVHVHLRVQTRLKPARFISILLYYRETAASGFIQPLRERTKQWSSSEAPG